MDITFESIFNLNPLAPIQNVLMEEFDPARYFETFDSEFDEIMVEASGVTKSNLLNKILKIIDKLFKWFIKMGTHLVNGIRTLVRGKAKSADQICRTLGLPKHDYVRTKMDPNDPNFVANAADNLHTNFIEGITEDGIIIRPSALVNANPSNVPIKGKDIAGGGTRASQVLDLILNPKLLEEYMIFFRNLTNDGLKDPITPADVTRIYSLCKKFVGRPSIASYAKDAVKPSVNPEHASVVISINELLEFQKKVSEMDGLCEKVDDVFRKLNVSLGDDPKIKEIEADCIKVLNELSWASVNLQGGLHAISNGMRGIYQLDSGYKGVIETPEILARFVEEAMKSGMPGKYLVNNIYIICHESVKGKPDVNKPLMGFGRLTLLPKGDIIYKVAINQYGIRSNKNDFAVMNAVKGTPLMSMFAETTNTYNYIINVMEKVKAGSAFEPSVADASKLGEEINKGLVQNNVGFQIYDIKSDAFGQKDGKYVILDYGYLHRRAI